MGNKAVAPPNSTANKSNEIVPRIAGVRRTNPTPANNADHVGGSLASTGRSNRIAPLNTPATRKHPAMTAYGKPGETAYAKPPSAGAQIVATWYDPPVMDAPFCSKPSGVTPVISA